MPDQIADERAMRLICHNKAESMWATFTDNEKAAVRFGMMPAAKMQEAVSEGHDTRLLAVALMNCASRDGGMVC